MNILDASKLLKFEKFDTPILIIYFNRPRHLEKLLISLKSFSPAVIYFACDGAREGNYSDQEKIKECDDLIDCYVDWSCKKTFLKGEFNYGCDEWVPRSISWLFSMESKGIILEDDCIVDVNFCQFAGELLERYENIPQIMSISALSFLNLRHQNSDSYHYSCYPLTWGWATWGRSWRHYDDVVKVNKFNSDIRPWLLANGFTSEEIKYWEKFFTRLECNKVTFWDAKWIYSIWLNKGLSITPSLNLVKNIGVGNDATHTKASHDIPSLKINILHHPLKHPSKFLVCSRSDRETFVKKFKFTIKKKFLFILKLMLGVSK